MRLLLDSHILIWWLAGDPRLGGTRREALENGEPEVHVSAVSVWELALKRVAGKLDLGKLDLVALLERHDLVELPLAARHAEAAVRLPPIHRDPIDRFLIAQALVEGLTLVSDDATIHRYPVPTL